MPRSSPRWNPTSPLRPRTTWPCSCPFSARRTARRRKRCRRGGSCRRGRSTSSWATTASQRRPRACRGTTSPPSTSWRRGIGRIDGLSTAGAEGPMQFLPSTWAECCTGDIENPRDAIIGAGVYLQRSGGPADMDRAILRYNRDTRYRDAIKAYAANMAADERVYPRLPRLGGLLRARPPAASSSPSATRRRHPCRSPKPRRPPPSPADLSLLPLLA